MLSMHTKRLVSPVFVVLQLRPVSGRGPWFGDQCHTSRHWPMDDLTLLYITLSTPLSQLTSALFLAITSQHVLCAPPAPICCRSLVSTQPLLPAVSALLSPQYGTHSLLAFTLVLHHILSVVFLKPIVSIRHSVPPSGSHKCLRLQCAP